MRQQGSVDVGETPVEVERVSEIRRVRQHRVERVPLLPEIVLGADSLDGFPATMGDLLKQFYFFQLPFARR